MLAYSSYQHVVHRLLGDLRMQVMLEIIALVGVCCTVDAAHIQLSQST